MNAKKYFDFSITIAILFILGVIGMFAVSPPPAGVRGLISAFQNLIFRGFALSVILLPLAFLVTLTYGLFHLKKVDGQQKKELRRGILINLAMAILSGVFILFIFSFLFTNIAPR